MARAKVRCFSCAKLKIKCDEARPRCEYCCHTNRKCIYPEYRKAVCGAKRVAGCTFLFANMRQEENGLVTTFIPEKLLQKTVTRRMQFAATRRFAVIPEKPIQKRQKLRKHTKCAHVRPYRPLFCMNLSVNSNSNHLHVSSAVFRLLQHFHTGFVPILQDILQKLVWSKEFPSCWQWSSLVRCNAHLLGYVRYADNSLCFQHIRIKRYLLQTVYDSFAAIRNGPSSRQAGPLAVLTFLMLVFQPFQVFQLCTFDQLVDMLNAIRQLRGSIGLAEPICPDSYEGKYPAIPLVSYLHCKLSAYVGMGLVEKSDICLYYAAVDLLGDVLGTGKPASVLRWPLLVGEPFFDRAAEGEPFALKLLYVYSCFSAVAKLRLQPYTLYCVFRQYIENYWLHGNSRPNILDDNAFEYHLYLHVRFYCVQPVLNGRSSGAGVGV